jgi:hypothetical protein
MLPARFGDRAARHPAALALAAYALIDAAYFGWHVLPHVNSVCACLGGGDPISYMWFLAWWPHALLHGINPFVTHELFAPGATNLGAVELVPGAAIVVAPITLLFGPLVAYNLVALAAPLLAATFAFLLCRYVSGSTVAALVGGYIFGFSPYLLGHLEGHLDLILIFPIPAAVHLTLRLIDGRISPRAYVGLTALAIGFLLLSQPELTLLFVLLGACGLGVALILVPGARSRILAALPTVAAAGLLAVVLTSVFIYYALSGPTSAGFFNGYSETYVADALGFLTPTALIRLGRAWFAPVSATFTGNLAESEVYVGIVLTVVLARFAITRWASAATRLLVVMLGLVVILMLGPHLHVAGRSTVPLPWNWLDRLPLLGRVAPVRMAVFMYLIISVMVALWLGRTAPGRLGAAKWAVALLAVLTLVPNVGSGVWRGVTRNPPFFRTGLYKSVIPRNSIVLPVPFAQWDSSMLWQAETGFAFRIADGYVGALLPPGFAGDLGSPPLSQFPGDPQPAVLRHFLAARRVSTVLVDAAVPGPWPAALSALGLHGRLMGGEYVYRVIGARSG